MLPDWVDPVFLVVWLGVLGVRAAGYRRRGATGAETWMVAGCFWVAYFLLQVGEMPSVTAVAPGWFVTVLAGLSMLGGGYIGYRILRRRGRVSSADSP